MRVVATTVSSSFVVHRDSIDAFLLLRIKCSQAKIDPKACNVEVCPHLLRNAYSDECL